MFSFFRHFGQMLGVAIGGAVLQNVMEDKLSAYPDTAEKAWVYSRDASALVQVIKSMPPSRNVTKRHLIQAYVDSLGVLWIVMCVFAGISLIAAALWVKDVSLDRELETEQGFKHDIKPTDSELTLGNSRPTTRDKRRFQRSSQLTLGGRPETANASRASFWRRSELTLGPSLPNLGTAPAPAIPPRSARRASQIALANAALAKETAPHAAASRDAAISTAAGAQTAIPRSRRSSTSSNYTTSSFYSMPNDSNSDNRADSMDESTTEYHNAIVNIEGRGGRKNKL